jgi:hypothetical protein
MSATYGNQYLKFKKCNHKTGSNMETFYILVMNKNNDDDNWKISKRADSKDELRNLSCYNDPPCGELPKLNYPGTWLEDLEVKRCADMTIVDDGAIYEIHGN